MIFKMRTTKPESGNKYYIRKSSGGYSPCITGKPTDPDCNVLSNCVGYAVGRFNEEIEANGCKYLKSCNAENFIRYNPELESGQSPRLGSVMCWEGKGSKAGHVAIVEKIDYVKRRIETTNSAYNGKTFYTRTLSMDNNYYMGSAYTFQGFIYPDVEFYDGGGPIPPTPQIETKKHKFKWAIFTKKLRNRRLTE